MAGVPAFDPSDIPPEWIGDKSQYQHYSNKLKGSITAWRKVFTKVDRNVREFVNDPLDEMKDLSQQSFQNMEVAFAPMANAYDMLGLLAGTNDAPKENVQKKMLKFSSYEGEGDELEALLKNGFKRLRASKEIAEAKARTDKAAASAAAAAQATASAGAKAEAAATTPDISAVYCQALKPKSQLSTECKPKV